jgi:hypothetical protein
MKCRTLNMGASYKSLGSIKNWPRWRNRRWAMASQSHRICVADSSYCRHLSQVGSSVSPSLKRCPLKWQCPVSSPTTHLNWSLFSSNWSFVRLAEGPDMNPFACLSPVVDSQCFLCFLFVQSLTAFLASPIEMPQAQKQFTGLHWTALRTKPLLSSMSRSHFQTHNRSCGEHRLGNEFQQYSIPQASVLARFSSTLLDWPGLN